MAHQINMQQLLYNMAKTDASDLHLKVGMPPIFRIGSELRVPQGLPKLSADDTMRLVTEIMPENRMEQFNKMGDVDFSTFRYVDNPDISAEHKQEARPNRFRCNVFRAGGAAHAAIRRVKPDIPTFESLHLPDVYRKIADTCAEGLVLVVGVTGCGKSTTLACMLERVNSTRAENIVTIEDPVEYTIHPKMSIVSQREIGTDVPTYGEALKYVVRQDPDVIFIGELRDHDTVMAAVQAAETGHLVFGSLHTADTMQTFGRIVEFFPQNEHAFIRSALANSIQAVCAQRLLPANKDVTGTPVIPATEVLLTNGSVREKIRDGDDTDLPVLIQAGRQDGMRSFTDSLAELVENESVALHTAMEYASNREALSSRLKGVQVRSATMTGKR